MRLFQAILPRFYTNMPMVFTIKLVWCLSWRSYQCYALNSKSIFYLIHPSAKLSSMNIIRSEPSANHIKLFIEFPKAVREYKHVKYSIAARSKWKLPKLHFWYNERIRIKILIIDVATALCAKICQWGSAYIQCLLQQKYSSNGFVQK